MHIYEYLFTAIIILSMLFASSTMITTLSEPSRNVSEREQLKITAQKLMAQILLDPGDPADWGNDLTVEGNLKTFGLAKHSETTRDAYVLDPYKVLRLNDALLQLDRSLYIPPSRLRDLLNLGNEYGLALEFSPALVVSIDKKGSDRYELTVMSEYGGLPIVGANVTARMYYYDVDSNNVVGTDLIVNETEYRGKCIVDFGSIPSEMKILIVLVEYYGMRLVRVFSAGSNLIRAHLLGDFLFVDKTCTISRDEVYEIIVSKRFGGYSIENVESSLSKIEDGRFRLTYVEPSTVATLTVSQDGGNLIFSSLEANVTYSMIAGKWSFPFAYSVERTVTIGGSLYNLRLYLWRMSW